MPPSGELSLCFPNGLSFFAFSFPSKMAWLMSGVAFPPGYPLDWVPPAAMTIFASWNTHAALFFNVEPMLMARALYTTGPLEAHTI